MAESKINIDAAKVQMLSLAFNNRGVYGKSAALPLWLMRLSYVTRQVFVSTLERKLEATFVHQNMVNFLMNKTETTITLYECSYSAQCAKCISQT